MGGKAVFIALAACGFLAVACGSAMAAAENEGTGRELQGYSWNPPPAPKYKFKLNIKKHTRGDTKKNTNVGKNTAGGYVANNVNPQMNQVDSRGAQHSYVENKVIAGNSLTVGLGGGGGRKLQGYSWNPPPAPKYKFKLNIKKHTRGDTKKNTNIGKNTAEGYIANNVNPQMNQVDSRGDQGSGVHNVIVADNTVDLGFGGIP